MMIITDTASDIFEDEAKEMDIELVALDISFGDEHCTGNTPAVFQRFYELLSQRKDFPKTSQPSPEAYLRLYKEAQRRGEEVLVIALSGALSGTVESARVAARLSDWQDHILIMDSRHAIASQRFIVERAVQLRDEGLTPSEILPHLEDLRDRICICGVLDTLEYLKRGGRVPAALALIGDLLHIKPVITVDDGRVESINKTHGRHAGENFLKREFERFPRDKSWPVSILYSCDRKLSDIFGKSMQEEYQLTDIRNIQIGPTIGAHLGPNCVGLAFVSQKPITAVS